ncbi:flagellar motor stator protein MotA [Zavarzinia sp. CC-PAN008]|uniref:flagellar motor stator protein MotA n=1 Tax=Zavarzinia sp. CC-PAN008 TaxID=3243332 RepID=UPI003F7431C6
MFAIIGIVVVFVCVFGIYILAGGNMDIVLHALPIEMGTIMGAAIGTFLIANSMHTIKHAIGGMKKVLSGSKYKAEHYTELLSCLFALQKLAKTKGALALESHIEKPEESAIFQAYPLVMEDHHALHLICDYMRMVTMGMEDPHQIEGIMEQEIEKILHEEQHAPHALQGMADGLPALGIVAAVLGIVKTMGSINEPPEVLGTMIGGALVGTFMGVLMAYGLVGPISARMNSVMEEENKFLLVIKAAIIAYLHGHPPQAAIETARKSVPSEMMPSFQDLEQTLSKVQTA